MSHGGAASGTQARWNARWTERGERPDPPSALLTERAEVLPTAGRALDVAGGTGRNARWLAQRGLAVTLVDVSDVALAQATREAARTGLDLTVVRADLSADPLPAGPFDVVVVHHYLDLPVWRSAAARLAPGGILLLRQPTVRNLERHPRPSRRWLLPAGAVAATAWELTGDDPAVEVLEATEGWGPEGRHEATIVLRRRPAA